MTSLVDALTSAATRRTTASTTLASRFQKSTSGVASSCTQSRTDIQLHAYTTLRTRGAGSTAGVVGFVTQVSNTAGRR